VFLLGCLLSGAAAIVWQGWLQADTEQRVTREAGELEARIMSRIEAYLALLRGARGLFAVKPDVTATDFRHYVAGMGIAQNYPGIQGIGFSVRIAPELVSVIEETQRRTGWPDFKIWPEGPRPEYHTIVYLEPQDARNRVAIGYDMHTDPVRRAAMDRARDSGQPAASSKVTLVQEIDANKQPGFLIYVPLYRTPQAPATEAERRQSLLGFVYGPFRAGDFITAIAARGIFEGVAVTVYDGAEESESTVFFRKSNLKHEGRGRTVSQVRTLRVADRMWTLEYSAEVQEIVSPFAVFLVGLAISGGAAFLIRREHTARSRAEQSEAETREREGELTLLIESVPALVSYVDADGVYRLCNHLFKEWFGAEPGQIVGRRMAEVIGAKLYAAVEPYVARAMKGEALTLERWYKTRWGARYLATLFVPHRIGSGRVQGIYALTSDLTSHKRAEEAARFVADCGKLLISSFDHQATAREVTHLAVPQVADIAVLFRVENDALQATAVAHADGDQQRKLEHFLREVRLPLAAPHNIAVAARSGTVVVTPQIAQAQLERIIDDPAQREMLRLLKLVSALHIPVVVRGKIWAVLSLGTSAHSGRLFSDQDRSLAEEISTRMRLAVENSLLLVEAQQEVQERRRAERAVRETEERFRLLVEGASDYAIILLHLDGRIASWNEGAKRILGFSEEEAIGMPVAQLFSMEDQEAGAPAKELARARESGSALDERWYVRKDGTRFWASGHTSVLRNEDGQIRGYAKIMRDLTGRKMTEEELERRVQERTMELNEAVQELEAFSYSVSHDLRSPLRSIRGFTELALEEAGPRLKPEERGYLSRVQRAVTRLDQLISDLLAYTRVSKTRVELVAVDLDTLVSDIQREHPEFQAPRARIRVAGPLLPVTGNVAYLTQCLTNLLGNAVKFVSPGVTPEVQVWTESVGTMVRLFVRDNGIGIPPQHLHRVFEMFERLHASAGYEGTGVGLAIVRRAVQRMKGSVGVSSEEGKGTTFWIELPAAQPSGAAHEAPQAANRGEPGSIR
jgi:PAS domain S-box-containing protein